MLARRGSLAVVAVAVALVPVGVATGARAGSAARPPCVAPETTRHHVFQVNLDRGRTRERVIVSNFDGEGTPISTFMVCKRYGGKWARVQRQRIVISPGSRSSGLADAWAGDLNRHGRIEIAARDRLTPSAGEVLTIFRQRARYALGFRKLQSIPGDVVKLHKRRGASATVSVLIKANHSADGRGHSQTWAWSSRAGRWTCRSDCRGFAAAVAHG